LGGKPKRPIFPLDAVQAGISPKPCSNNVSQRPRPRLSVIFPTVFFWCNDNMAKHDIATVRIQAPNDLGYLVRTHRKNKQLTLETFAELSHLSVQFLSDFEQGKNTGEIEKILKALQTLGLEIVVQPCGARLGHTDQNSLSEKAAPGASGCLQPKSSSTLLKSKSKR